MAGRNDARRCVLQMLYLIDQNADADIHWIKENIETELQDSKLHDFAWQLFTGIREQRPSIDEQITSVAQNWRIDRMSPTDRNILRMGIHEMQVVKTPPAVVLNESVELAREFGTENSASFVNGILDKLKPA